MENIKNFTFYKTKIDGVIVAEPKIFGDNRDYFMETCHLEVFAESGIKAVFVQDNQSKSAKGVLRGFHYQKNHPQAKLVQWPNLSCSLLFAKYDIKSKMNSN